MKAAPLRLLFAWICVMTRLAAAPADDPVAAFEQANKLYEQGRFGDAALLYEKILQTGQASPALYFNRGNALFKAGQTGRAIVNYRLAEKLSPRDPDIRANLQFVRNTVGSVTRSGFRWRQWINRLTLNEWTVLTAGAFWVWCLLLTLRQRNEAMKRSLRGYTAAAGATVLALITCLTLATRDGWSVQSAIVVAPEAMVRYGPLEESHSFYTARDGTELTVLDQKGDWLQVTDQANRTGWVRREQVLVLNAAAQAASS